ncbi:MAG: DUF1697 domain-containing protein [Bacteroidota bacterium]
MSVFLAMLRGINVSGKNKLKMEALRALGVDLGFQNVQTYIQSGNMVFEASGILPSDLAQQIKSAILQVHGYDVPVMVKTQKELIEVVAQNPFLDRENEKALHLTFLAAQPSAEQLASIETDRYLPDEWQAIGKSIYLFCPNGYGRTKLTNTFFERRLKMEATTRNWKTVNKLLEMMS